MNPRAAIRRIGLLLLIGAAVAAGRPGARAHAAVTPIPLAPPHEFVAIADRPVCSLLQGDANVRGQDGAASVSTLGKVFWGFGDTYVGTNTGAPNVNNSLGYTDAPDADPAADCVALQHKRGGASAVALLPIIGGECGAWPLGMAGLQSPNVHVFYVSVSQCIGGFAQNGIGLATFDGTQVPGFPSLRKGLVWPGNGTLTEGAQPFTGADTSPYLYIGIQGPPAANEPFSKTVRIARVPNTAAALEACVPESAPACDMEYWNPTTQLWKTAITSAGPAFTPILGTNGGVMFGWSSGLGKWLSTYATGVLFAVRGRTAPQPTGPWAGEEALLSYCPYFMLPGQGYCYTGYYHPEYDVDGGNTIYVTMATQRIPNNVIDTYTVFLHQIRLGKPVVQSVDADNHRRYALAGAPPGFSPEGAAFYASPTPVPGFAAVFEWTDPGTGDVLLATRQPDPAHTQQSAPLFYAPPRQVVSGYADAYEPVYRWDRGPGEHAYSPLTTLGAAGYTNAGIAFYTLCGDADADYMSDCAEINSANNPNANNGSIDGDVLLDDNGNPVTNAFGFPIPLGNMQSVAQDNGVRRQDIDNCPLADNPWQANTDSGPISTNGAATGPDITRPNGDILGDACDPDRDNDGLTDAQEAAGCDGFGPTAPTAVDSDDDHIADGYECLAGSDPSSAASVPPPPPAGDDADADGIPDGIEALLGTDPHDVDTDNDGLPDPVEARNWATDPTAADTDGDGCPDLLEAASVNGDWSVNALDLQLIAQRFASTTQPAFDVNRDGRINALDLQLTARAFGICTPPRHIDRAFSR
jgi:hypothetical protein